MKILFSADPYVEVPPIYYGGIERIVGSLLIKLQQRGHIIGLVAHPDSTSPADYFAGWSRVRPNSAIAHAQNTWTLLKAYLDFGPSLVHSFSRLLYLSPLLLKRTPKVMSYQRSTGGRQTRFAASLGGQSLVFTGCSEFIANMGRRHGGGWHAIPNFVDTGFFQFVPTVTGNAPLVFLSRVEAIKGAHIAIEVAKKTGRRLLIAGNHAESGAEHRYWQEVIKPELGRNGVEYVGAVNDKEKNELLGSACAMIVPIQWDEPFGIVFAESLACGTPVISCPRGALPEIIREGVDGFLTKSVEEACKAVDRVATINRRVCRHRAETSFSINVIVQRYEALYESLVRDS
jgi:glycosyltransferase involved in cell wall biosynthesis